MEPCQSQQEAHDAAIIAKYLTAAALVAVTATLQQVQQAQAAAAAADMQAANLVSVTGAALQQCRNQQGGGEMMRAGKGKRRGAA